jgi:hypothetical protein
MLRHSDIRTTMNLYTQDDRDEKQAAQGAFLPKEREACKLFILW